MVCLLEKWLSSPVHRVVAFPVCYSHFLFNELIVRQTHNRHTHTLQVIPTKGKISCLLKRAEPSLSAQDDTLLAVWHHGVFGASGSTEVQQLLRKDSHTTFSLNVYFSAVPRRQYESSSKITMFNSHALSIFCVSWVVCSVYFINSCWKMTLNFML